MLRSAVLEGLKKWISPVLSDRTPFRLERQQRSFKSDSGLGSEFEIGRRNSRGHACPLVPSRGVLLRASGARVGDRQFYEWGPHVVRTLCPDTQYTASARQLGE